MKTLETLENGDYIAFDYSYLRNDETNIEVARITSIQKEGGECLVHFSCGHHSVGEYIKFDDIIAIGDKENGKDGIKGWSGAYTALKLEHPSVEYGYWK